MNRQTHIAIYARVSSDQQAQQGTIESQLAAVQKFAAENGLKVDPDLIFADNGVSGGSAPLSRSPSTIPREPRGLAAKEKRRRVAALQTWVAPT